MCFRGFGGLVPGKKPARVCGPENKNSRKKSCGKDICTLATTLMHNLIEQILRQFRPLLPSEHLLQPGALPRLYALPRLFSQPLP